MSAKKVSVFYRPVKWMVKTIYPEICVKGEENLPQEPLLIVGNHSQMNGPIACELYTPGPHYTWCAGEMMCLKEVPAYAYRDFWSQKPRYLRWFYKLLSYLIAPLSVCIFNSANTIGVYHDMRVMSTFKTTVEKLREGARVVVFPEHDVPYNHILCQFQDRFIDVAKLYYKRTGQKLAFVPMYLAPKLRTMYYGKPIRFSPENSMEEERKRISQYLMEEITRIAVDLPRHTVVPYRNISPRLYPTNRLEESCHEKAGC